MKKTNIDLIPHHKNPTPDYYCTWQTQLYATCDGKPQGQRAAIGEKALFQKEKPFGWAHFYEKAREDLFLVMDDSWDVPQKDDRSYYGSLLLNPEKFPKSTENAKSNAEALKNLSQSIKSLGWKGLGGWVCAQESTRFVENMTSMDYWSSRLKDASESDFAYWKVDWGRKSSDPQFRKMLTELAREIAPQLVIEHAVIKEIIPHADVYRTYDVPAIMSIPMTMEKIAGLSDVSDIQEGCMGLINCEDEAYIAAAGGFAMGIMRHPYHDVFVDGRADMSFPALHRNLKTKIYEITRAVRWHRIAPAFAFDTKHILIDEKHLQDTWHLQCIEEEIESWWLNMPLIRDSLRDHVIAKTAPARIARNCKLPTVQADKNGNTPYVIAAKNPESGAFSVATLGRTMQRQYEIPQCAVSVDIGNADTVGVFGEYESLIMENTHIGVRRILMQDLADDHAYDITEQVTIQDHRIVIPGELIHKIGTISQPKEDTSEPGVIIRIESNETKKRSAQ